MSNGVRHGNFDDFFEFTSQGQFNIYRKCSDISTA